MNITDFCKAQVHEDYSLYYYRVGQPGDSRAYYSYRISDQQQSADQTTKQMVF